MPLTQGQFQKARDAGFSTDQIIEFEKKRVSEEEITPEETKIPSYQEQRSQQEKERRARLEQTPFGKALYKTTDYLTPQFLSGKEFAPGERNIFGDVGERPGSAIRGLFFPKEGESRLGAYKRAAITPETQPSAAESLYLKSGIQPTGNKLLDVAKAYPSAFAGQTMDIATQPINWLLGMFGAKAKQPIAKEFGKAKELVKSTTEEIISSPLGETVKRGFVNAVNNVKSLGNKFPKIMNRDWLISQTQKTASMADDTINGIRGEYDELYKIIGETKIDRTEVKNIIADLLRGATKEEADEILTNLRNNLGQYAKADLNTVKKIKDIVQSDIPENVWLKGRKGIDLTPLQQKKVNAYFKLKSITEKTLTGTEEGNYLSYLDKKATDVYRLSKTIKRMVIDQTGQPTETGRLTQAFSGKAGQAGKENLFYRLRELNEDAQEIITNMNKFRKRQFLKKAGVTVTGGYGLYELGRRIFGKQISQ